MTEAANYHEAGPDTQGDITDIDSIIEINGRWIVTTVEVGDLSWGQREEPTTAVVAHIGNRDHHYGQHKHRYRHRHHRQTATNRERGEGVRGPTTPRESWTRLNVSTGEGLIYFRSLSRD